MSEKKHYWVLVFSVPLLVVAAHAVVSVWSYVLTGNAWNPLGLDGARAFAGVYFSVTTGIWPLLHVFLTQD